MMLHVQLACFPPHPPNALNPTIQTKHNTHREDVP